MSSSNAAAIRRRAGTQASSQPPTPPHSTTKSASTNPSSVSSSSTQMTLQQVIATVDKRLIQLETIASANNATVTGLNPDLSVVVDEFNNRFELIVTEINSLKDIVMKLQTYTMEVNKMLVDERIHVLSDLGNNSVSSSTMNNLDDAQTLTSADLKSMVEQELQNGK